MTEHDSITVSPWNEWRDFTPARLALGRVGDSMPTSEVLRFGWAHATARDAIHVPLDVHALQSELSAAGWHSFHARSRAPDRANYLRRPDLGRRLDEHDRERLKAASAGTSPTICFVIGDGLSAFAVQRHAVPLLSALRDTQSIDLTSSPVVVATQARVAISDEIGETFNATLVVMFIGERPGLSSPDSLGVYMTYRPRVGLNDAYRNCISNIRPEGLPYGEAAFKLAWLMKESLRRRLTGINLKDESDNAVIEARSIQQLSR